MLFRSSTIWNTTWRLDSVFRSVRFIWCNCGANAFLVASASFLPKKSQGLQNRLVGSPCSPRDSLKSLCQKHSSKASNLRRSAFFTAQLSHPYVTTGKTIAFTRRTSVDKCDTHLQMSRARLQRLCNQVPRPAVPEQSCGCGPL